MERRKIPPIDLNSLKTCKQNHTLFKMWKNVDKILLTIPVTNRSGERSLSVFLLQLKRMKKQITLSLTDICDLKTRTPVYFFFIFF